MKRGRSPQRPDLVRSSIVPDYALRSHVAPLGLTLYTADNLPQEYRGGAFVGEHGSWDRRTFNGYKVVFVPFSDGHPSGKTEEGRPIPAKATVLRFVPAEAAVTKCGRVPTTLLSSMSRAQGTGRGRYASARSYC